MEQNTVLVVGGAGYIGSHMVLALQDAGYTPIVFDNLSRGHADAVEADTLFCGDLTRPAEIEACFDRHKIDLVMHFAAYAYVGESVTSPEQYYQNNVVGALNLLSCMQRRGIRKLVFSSTCATYGEPQDIPITESHVQKPINPYGRTKLFIEQALNDYGSAYGFQSISLRYFNAAGCDEKGRAGERHSPETHLIPLVLAEALRIQQGGAPEETRLQVFGDDFSTPDGTCIRDYIHVTDLCRAHLLAAERLLRLDSGGAECFNLSNNAGFSVLDVIRICREVTGQPIAYRVLPRRPGDPAELVGSNDLARRVLGWEPHWIDLQAIVQTAWSWMCRSQAM